ncbi:MAG: glycosyltransferase [Actinomycetota bacterium]|nr:glycosyltransferase [Actinomycetota bacterium]
MAPDTDSEGEGPPEATIDAVIPARNEAATVGAVVRACRLCPSTREVIVVDDGSTDGTAEVAAAAGARVVRRRAGAGASKAHALEAGADASDADAFLFCDADLVGITPGHLDAICRPWLDGRAAMSVGWFDYGLWNPVVLRLAPTTGERLVPRWGWESVSPAKRSGYSIEIMINEVIAEGRLPTTARILAGVTHRSKRAKFGSRTGRRETWRMFWHLIGLPTLGVVRWRTWWFYLRQLTVED